MKSLLSILGYRPGDTLSEVLLSCFLCNIRTVLARSKSVMRRCFKLSRGTSSISDDKHSTRTPNESVTRMQGPPPNRMGLGMRGPMGYGHGQGPPIGSLPPSNAAYQPHLLTAANVSSGPMQKATTLFVGSISAGIPDSFLSSLFSVSA